MNSEMRRHIGKLLYSLNAGEVHRAGDQFFIKTWRIPVASREAQEFETVRYGIKYLVRKVKQDIGAGDDKGWWVEVVKQLTY